MSSPNFLPDEADQTSFAAVAAVKKTLDDMLSFLSTFEIPDSSSSSAIGRRTSRITVPLTKSQYRKLKRVRGRTHKIRTTILYLWGFLSAAIPAFLSALAVFVTDSRVGAFFLGGCLAGFANGSSYLLATLYARYISHARDKQQDLFVQVKYMYRNLAYRLLQRFLKSRFADSNSTRASSSDMGLVNETLLLMQLKSNPAMTLVQQDQKERLSSEKQRISISYSDTVNSVKMLAIAICERLPHIFEAMHPLLKRSYCIEVLEPLRQVVQFICRDEHLIDPFLRNELTTTLAKQQLIIMDSIVQRNSQLISQQLQGNVTNTTTTSSVTNEQTVE